MLRLLVSTGEVSGDLQGALLVQALYEEASRRGLELQVVALGGDRMARAGAELLADTTRMGAIGLLEVMPFVLPTLRLQRRLKRWFRQAPPDGVVLIDYMGPNVNLGLRLKRRFPGVPVTYYIAPQEWAFKFGSEGRTNLIRFTNQILAIFQEEARYYGCRGANVTYVGHPLVDTVEESPSRSEARALLGLVNEAPVLLLMPASRRQELRYMLPYIVAAAAELQRCQPELQVVVPAGLSGFEAHLSRQLDQAGVKALVIPAADADRLKPALCAAADLALAKSGTVNLELALRGVPQVVVYRVSGLTAFVARRILRFSVPHISPVNLVLGERLVPELLQADLTAEAIVRAARPLLQPDSGAHGSMLEGYARLRAVLGEPGVTRRAAAAILDLVLETP
ncbi:lipid-A-disaccharide synthase [Cyanobium sp. LEGE 06143]|uniref:lipid-A-disaccharide synthase n=1 Tax=unclassified Cyanobium TaxID=2627006 RepID=UPI00164530E2|nr:MULTISPECIES: lipid-A-disaccharide synthase [unclassified Cyanobium]MBE9173644.1 lipid-A-disaccharide synthase [Cyanobium sp. LEGE 06143]QNI69902.1 lipid-A-disaccharide synthase [Cyanobium sp. NS01]